MRVLWIPSLMLCTVVAVTSAACSSLASRSAESAGYDTSLSVPKGKKRAYVVIAPDAGPDAGKEWMSVIDLPQRLNAVFCFTEDQQELLCWTYDEPRSHRRPDAWLDAGKVRVHIGGELL